MVNNNKYNIMKINFGKYTYFGDINKNYNNNSQYAFDKSYFDKLIGNRQYNDAADYASKYHFSDPQTQKLLYMFLYYQFCF